MDKQRLNFVLEDLASSVGPYCEAIVIGGGYAPLIFREFLVADQKLPQAAATYDLDLLIPRKTKVKVAKGQDLGFMLVRAGFVRHQRSLDKPPVESYAKDYFGVDVQLEFLSDNKSRDQKHVVQLEGVSAQTLSFLEMSLDESVTFVTLNGMKLQVVLPAAWMFHKLLTFGRRKALSKKLKDLYGAWYVGTVLNGLSQQAWVDFRRLRQQHKKWYQTAKKLVESFIAEATPEVWTQLEGQDPEGILTQQRFKLFVNQFLKD
jgi:hypothetical protein